MGALAGILLATASAGDGSAWADVAGRPAWRWSLDGLLAVPGLDRCAIVVRDDDADRFRSALPPEVQPRCMLVAAGPGTRSDAVRAGFTVLVDAGLPEDAVLVVQEAAAVHRSRTPAGLAPPAVFAGQRAGIGFDAHRLEAGRLLRLGGLAFPDEPRGLAGHSDGDVVLHALVDAVLGAAHLGDIGALFPSDDPRWAGIDSGELLRDAMARVADAGFRLEHADLVVVAARPALAPVRGAMEARIAELAGVAPGRISVKATTTDGLGLTAGEGIAAHAVAVLASGRA